MSLGWKHVRVLGYLSDGLVKTVGELPDWVNLALMLELDALHLVEEADDDEARIHGYKITEEGLKVFREAARK